MKYRILKPWGVYKAGDVIEGDTYGGNGSKPITYVDPGMPGMSSVNPDRFPDWFQEVSDEPERWKPEVGGIYFTLDFSETYSVLTVWSNKARDDARYATGAAFKTRQEAEFARDKVKALLLSLHKGGEPKY